MGSWPGQGGGWKNSQTAALRLILSFSMLLETNDGFGLPVEDCGTFGRKVMSRLARQRVGADAGRRDLPHARVLLVRVLVVSCMLACAHILLTGDIACACRKMLALACSPDGALSNLAGPDDQNSNEVRRSGKHAHLERRCFGQACLPLYLSASLSASLFSSRSLAC
jgi:hypothetical protein